MNYESHAHSVGGAPLSGRYSFAQLIGYPLLRGDLVGMSADQEFLYDRVVSNVEAKLELDEVMFHTPVHLLSTSLSRSAMRSICKFLCIPLFYRLKADGLRAALSQFCCSGQCKLLMVVFVRNSAPSRFVGVTAHASVTHMVQTSKQATCEERPICWSWDAFLEMILRQQIIIQLPMPNLCMNT